jgi:hypothetical protein
MQPNRLTSQEFLRKTSFENLLKIKSPQELATLKKIKQKTLCNGRCKSNMNSIYYCHSCSKVQKLMCRHYHTEDPLQELVCRLAYEYMFDIISYTDLCSDKWYNSPKRDSGHNWRVYRMAHKSYDKLHQCKWLKIDTLSDIC